jgi:hypothetical protein
VSNTRDARLPPSPSELRPVLVFVQRFFSCLLALVFQPCMVLHVFSILQKSITMIFYLRSILCLASKDRQVQNLNFLVIEGATDHWHRFGV